MRCERVLLPIVCVIACESQSGGSFGGLLGAISDRVQGDVLGRVLDSAEEVAKDAVRSAPAVQVGLPALPAKATGGFDAAKEVTGKVGTVSKDIDGDGDPETITVVEPEGGGTPYVSWEKDGVCYLAWKQDGKTWVQFGRCDDDSGAIVCQGTESIQSCKACTAEGVCQSCDAADLSTCSWEQPTSGDAGQDGVGDGSSEGGEGSADVSVGSDDASGDGLEGADVADSEDPADGSFDSTDADDAGDGVDSGAGDDAGVAGDGGRSDDGQDGPDPATCADINNCTLPCFGEDACLEACFEDAPQEAVDAWQAWEQCVATYCPDPETSCAMCDAEESACYGDDPTDGGEDGTESGEGWDASDAADAADGTADGTDGSWDAGDSGDGADGSGLGCLGLDSCLADCTDEACAEDCYASASPDAVSLWETYAQCVQLYCAGDPSDCPLCAAEIEACIEDG